MVKLLSSEECSAEHHPAAQSSHHLLDKHIAEDMARFFSALADPTRIRIIGLLADRELCVGDLHGLLEMTQPAISHQLRLLRDLRLVRSRKEGRHVYYALDDDHIFSLYHQGLTHMIEGKG